MNESADEFSDAEWEAICGVLDNGNESYTGGDILRRLCKAGFKVARLGSNETKYLTRLLDDLP